MFLNPNEDMMEWNQGLIFAHHQKQLRQPHGGGSEHAPKMREMTGASLLHLPPPPPSPPGGADRR